MINTIKEKLASCENDGIIYLIKKISTSSGFFMTDGRLLYMVFNDENDSQQSISTQFLRLNTNVEVLSIESNQQFTTGKYNILEFVKGKEGYCDNDLEVFINLCVAHTEYMNAKEFVSFFYSIINLFQSPREQQYKNLVGFYGELVLMRYIFNETGKDISSYWHNGDSCDKYDFSLAGFNVEVKTTSSFDEDVTIKHDQIFNMDKNYLAVVIVEENKQGNSLGELLDEMISSKSYCNNYNFYLNAEKEKKRVSPIELDNKKFVVKEIVICDCKKNNPFAEIPDSVSGLTYKLNVMELVSMSKNEVKEIF